MPKPTTPPTTKPTPGPQDAAKFVKQHPAITAVMAGGALGFFVLARARTKSSSSNGAGMTIQPAAMADTSAMDLQTQIDALATSIATQRDNLPTQPGSTTPTIPAKGSDQVLYVPPGASTGTLYNVGDQVPKGGTVCQGDVCLGPADFDALGRYLASLPGGH